MVSEGETVDRMTATNKKRRTSRQLPYLTLLDSHMIQLRQVERRMDGLLRQIVDGLNEEELLRSSERFDELVVMFPTLRLSNLDQHPEAVRMMLGCFDLERGPLPGFEEAIGRLCDLCVTPQALRGLRSRLYSVAALVAETRCELLSTAAIAFLSLDAPDPSRNTFLRMVVCASAIEWFVLSGLSEGSPVCLDVSAWLAADPSDALLSAIGEGRAYYYASIPGIFPFLDRSRVLFETQRLVSHTRACSQSQDRHNGHVLNRLVDKDYKALLRAEIRRVQGVLRWQYPASAIADLEMLTNRALEALDELSPHVNPLLQAIFVQSWVRYFGEMC